LSCHPTAPELNPAGRLVEKIRRRVEDHVSDTLAEKQAAMERSLQAAGSGRW
jgi:hypothetical protein